MKRFYSLLFILLLLQIAITGLLSNEVTIGAGDQQALIPFNFCNYYSLYETLYYPDEIQWIGLIEAIKYYNNIDQFNMTQNVQIWIGETTQTNLSQAWIPSSQLTLVYDGPVSFPNGQNVVTIPLTTPFVYSGTNLVIMTRNPYMSAMIGPEFFNCQTIGTNRARNFFSDTINPDPTNPPTTGAYLSVTGQFPKTTLSFAEPTMSRLGGLVRSVSNQPIVSATVQIPSLTLSTNTSATGSYSFPYAPSGTYQVTASKPGYITQTQTAVIIDMTTTVLNFILQEIANVVLTGRVINSAAPGNGIENAQVTLSGAYNVTAITNNEGYFTISNVPVNQSYTLTISKAGFISYTNTIQVTNHDLNLGNILLEEILMPPDSVFAVGNSQDTAFEISWHAPLIEAGRMLLGYKVWRLLPGQESNESLWTLLYGQTIWATNYTDMGYLHPNLGTWTVKWAVKAVYTGDYLSAPAFSNPIVGGTPAGLIKGIVTNPLSNAVVSGVTISYTPTNNQSVSNSVGYYSLVLPTGSYSLTAAKDGYIPYQQQNIVITDGDTTTVDIMLNPIVANPEEQVPTMATALNDCYPNPFNQQTKISYDIKEPVQTSIEIYNTKGQRIKTLKNELTKSGRYSIMWNGTDNNSKQVAAGVYILKMQAGRYSASTKVILMN